MRVDVETIVIGSYKFVLEYDSGGDPEYPFILWISQNGKGLTNKYFKKNYSKFHVRNFCLKFVNNDKYRNDIINQPDWKKR